MRTPYQMLTDLLERYDMSASCFCKQVGVSCNTITSIKNGRLISPRFAVLMDRIGYPGTEMFHEQALWQLNQISEEVRNEITKNIIPLQ